MTEPLDLAPIEDRDAHAECVDLCHQPQADRRALLAEVKRAWVRLARYEAQEARIRALVAEWQQLEAYAWIFFDEAAPAVLAALDEPEPADG